MIKKGRENIFLRNNNSDIGVDLRVACIPSDFAPDRASALGVAAY